MRSDRNGGAAVIAVGNLKGGTGKSTVAVNLACALAASGRPSLVIDADPQLTASQWLRRGAMPARLHAAPPPDPLATPTWLYALRSIGVGQDFIVIDLPAVLGATLAAALLVADLVLIPTTTSGLDLSATTRTLHRVAKARDERRNGNLESLVVPTRLESGWFRDGGLRRLKIRVPAPLAPPIRHSPLFAQAFDAAEWIGAFAPRSKAHRDILRLMRKVTDTIEARPEQGRLPARALSTVAAAGITA